MTIFSCKKNEEEDEPVNYEYISSTMDIFKFKIGSYWVYENDSTHMLDSIAVTSIKHGYFWRPPLAPGTGSNTKIEYYKINYHDYLNSTNFNDFIFSSLITRGGNENPTFGQPILFHKYPVGYKLYGTEVIDTDLSLDIFGTTFTGVEKMKINYAEQFQMEFSHDTYLYYKDSIGLIKTVLVL